MKTITLKHFPGEITYHPDWEGVIQSVADEYCNRYQWLLADFPDIETELRHIFNVFQLPFKNKKVLVICPEPFDTQVDGFPMMSDDVLGDIQLKVFMQRLASSYRCPIPRTYDASKSDHVFVWNVSLTKGGKTIKQFWKQLSLIVLNYIQQYIKLFVTIGNIFPINLQQDLELKKVTIVKTESLWDRTGNKWGEKNKVFETLDELFKLINSTESRISWGI